MIAAIFIKRQREEHPLKQGLRLGEIVNTDLFRLQREEHPLKQGLRRLCEITHIVSFYQREEHPLKQGLRQRSSIPTSLASLTARRTSTKTRIKTMTCIFQPSLLRWQREEHPLKQGLRQ